MWLRRPKYRDVPTFAKGKSAEERGERLGELLQESAIRRSKPVSRMRVNIDLSCEAIADKDRDYDLGFHVEGTGDVIVDRRNVGNNESFATLGNLPTYATTEGYSGVLRRSPNVGSKDELRRLALRHIDTHPIIAFASVVQNLTHPLQNLIWR